MSKSTFKKSGAKNLDITKNKYKILYFAVLFKSRIINKYI